MSGNVVRTARWNDLLTLARQAQAGVRQDYGFYPEAIQRQIMARNSFKALAMAGLRRGRLVLVAESGGQIAGQLVGATNNDGVAIVNWLFVEPSFRAGGLGSALLADFEARLVHQNVHKIMLWTEIAAGYYQKLGWSKEAELPRHWWGQDFSVMAKYIKPKREGDSLARESP